MGHNIVNVCNEVRVQWKLKCILRHSNDNITLLQQQLYYDVPRGKKTSGSKGVCVDWLWVSSAVDSHLSSSLPLCEWMPFICVGGCDRAFTSFSSSWIVSFLWTLVTKQKKPPLETRAGERCFPSGVFFIWQWGIIADGNVFPVRVPLKRCLLQPESLPSLSSLSSPHTVT